MTYTMADREWVEQRFTCPGSGKELVYQISVIPDRHVVTVGAGRIAQPTVLSLMTEYLQKHGSANISDLAVACNTTDSAIRAMVAKYASVFSRRGDTGWKAIIELRTQGGA